MVPLVLLTYATIHLADQTVVQEVTARVRTTSAVTAVLLQQQLQAISDLTESYATRTVLIAALADGNPANFHSDVIGLQLAQLQGPRPTISGTFLTDTSCRLTHVEPATPEIVGVDFSSRDWCKGVKSTGRPYISEAYRTAISGQPLVVAVASIVHAVSGDASSPPLGVLATVVSLDSIRVLTDQLAAVQGIHLTVTDQRGTLLSAGTASPDGLTSVESDPRVREALAGRSGVSRSATEHGDALSAFSPVASIGWTVTAAVPTDRALAGVSRLRSTVLGIAGLLGLVLMAGLIVMRRMLRARQAAERSSVARESETRAILEAATDAFVSMDAGGHITGWNSQAHQIFGWPEDDALGRKLSETIIPPEHREHHELGLAHFLATGEGPVLNQRIEITALHRDGHRFPVELAIWPVRSQDTWSFNAFVHDITERQRADTDLATARDQALDASRLKSEFLANMSHEIRTPMNGVLGMTSLLLDTDLTADQRQFAETVRVSGEHLLGLLNDILDLSKIEAGRLQLESVEFDLGALVEDVASLLSVAAHKKGIELACSLPVDMPATVRGDPGRVRQVLANLAGNAVKFTASGEVVIDVALDLGAGSPATFDFRVIDTGIGIAQEHTAGLFQTFSQGDSATTRRYGGTGLGLAISRQLVELMGGRIGFRSELGRGSTFSFTVPLDLGRSPAEDVRTVSMRGMRALVVDDNATNREILTRYLQSWGMRTQAAEGASPALEALTSSAANGEPFHAVLLDLNMPDVDGIELARRITATPDIPDVPAVGMILLTSSGQEDIAERAREAGISAFLTKPIRRAQLHTCLVGVLVTAPEPIARPIVVRPERTGRLLLAEDNVVNQQVALAMLTMLGFEVDIVSDGTEAVKAATTTPYQAILMDCQMPHLDGYDATREIRRLGAMTHRVPIIAITASAMPSDQERCLAAGMDEYLTKPLNLEMLAAVLDRWTR